MKITKISLQNFRAFDVPFVLDLADGKNLLLHGENGAGKTSIYFALKRFFEEHGDDISQHGNIFDEHKHPSRVSLHLKGIDSSNNALDRELVWNGTDVHPLKVPKDPSADVVTPLWRSLLVDGSRRAGFLDYRLMQRTNLMSGPLPRYSRDAIKNDTIYGVEAEGLEEQLFDLVSMEILSGVRVSMAGGKETSLGSLMRAVWNTSPAWRYKNRMSPATKATTAFNQAFNAILPKLVEELKELLKHFDNHKLDINFDPVSLSWNKSRLVLEGAKLTPIITFNNEKIANYHLFLNEARLSALGLCLFLAGVLLSDVDKDNPNYPRFLVLDDALMGLELQNRLPVLKILKSEAFKNYQIFLLTHDRVWFDLARGHLCEKDGWLHRELLADEDTGHVIPRLVSSESDLERAKTHLRNGDRKASAVYARSAFEWKLRLVCDKCGIKIPFKPDADKIGAGKLWDGILARQREREVQRSKGSVVPDFVPPTLEAEVEMMRSTVLNKLSHTGASGLVQTEVDTALATVKKVHDHPFP